jgi:DICT domain-containing protein
MLEGSILKQLKETHPSFGNGRSLNFGVYYKNTLVALCHALEDSILDFVDSQPLVITAFQRGKWYLQEADRYGEIANRAEQIVIMASSDTGFREHPTSQRSNVALVDLDDQDPVAQEWHLIILAPDYTAMVLCQELSPDDYGPTGVPEKDLERKFYGFWTFEPRLVLETAKLAIAHIGSYQPDLQQALKSHTQRIGDQVTSYDVLNLPAGESLGNIVSRVVDYLQASQDELSQNSIDQYWSSGKLNHNLVSNELQAFLRVAELMDYSDVSNQRVSAEVAALAEALGQLLDLPAWQVHRLRLAGLLHRLAFLQNVSAILPSDEAAYPVDLDPSAPPSCPLILGTQVLRTMPRLRAVSTIITHQTEWWDGSGQPAGLAGDEIPLESRILGLASEFQQQLAQFEPTDVGLERFDGVRNADDLDQALATCAQQAGSRWDPKLVDALTLLVNGLKQGLSLSVTLPKIASGLWMLDSHSEDDLLQLYR